MRIEMLEQEFWFGGYVHEGVNQPIGKEAMCTLDLRVNQTPNQAMPLFLSSKGRYLWSNHGFVIRFENGIIEVPEEVVVGAGYQDLKGAYLHAMKKYFPFQERKLSMELFRQPIYNSWIELTFYQNERDIMAYANQILNNGMPPGVLMIDDGWSDYYGHWVFSKGKFPNPKEMIRQLYDKGFHVMLWVAPYVTPDTVQYRELRDKGLLIKTKDGKPYITEWWNGFSAVLDMSNPATNVWLREKLDQLCELGVAGFKFDGGDSTHYSEDLVTFGNVSPDEQSMLWAKFGEQYAFNEFRVTSKAGGMALLQRLCDKEHAWGNTGINALVPNSLLQGITGHPFCSPDMIGGGEYLNFQEIEDGSLDQELFVRHSEIACLMPAMQFSAAPFRVLDTTNFQSILNSIQIRGKFIQVIEYLVQNAQRTGEPIIRYMIYEFPNEPVERITDQFMLGSTILVAPVTEKGKTGRGVYLPKGIWHYENDIIESTGGNKFFTSQPGQPIVLIKQ
ncbi:glycoside hydrolase family 31 protein [Neobacillus niacini]|uniref:glycoside hydrolase family 31 protein n=1 Tax=Neobacillus niacini TaxID=86668 RepID=UPI003B010B22